MESSGFTSFLSLWITTTDLVLIQILSCVQYSNDHMKYMYRISYEHLDTYCSMCSITSGSDYENVAVFLVC